MTPTLRDGDPVLLVLPVSRAPVILRYQITRDGWQMVDRAGTVVFCEKRPPAGIERMEGR